MSDKFEAFIAALPEKLFAGYEDTAGAGHHGPPDGRRIFLHSRLEEIRALHHLTPDQAINVLINVRFYEEPVAKAIVRAMQVSGYVELDV